MAENTSRRMRFAARIVCVALACGALLALPRGASAQAGSVPTFDGMNLKEKIIHIGKTMAQIAQDGQNLVENKLQTIFQGGVHFKEFIGDPAVTFIAKTALRGITQSIVNWINSGFEGSPSFVTNPEGFIVDIADQTIGRAIQGIDPFLCEPFRLQLQFALGLEYGYNAAPPEVRCRLTDVIENVQGAYDAFVQGSFVTGGWNSWINIAGMRQNNPYGAYIATVDKLDLELITATGERRKLLDLGRGFMSWRECEVPGAPYSHDPNGIAGDGDEVTRYGPCQKEGPIKTPGSVIEGQLQNALNIDLQGLALADEINEIVGALANHLVSRVLLRGGLARGTDYNYSGRKLPELGNKSIREAQDGLRGRDGPLNSDTLDSIAKGAPVETAYGGTTFTDTRTNVEHGVQSGRERFENEGFQGARDADRNFSVGITGGTGFTPFSEITRAGGKPLIARQSSVLSEPAWWDSQNHNLGMGLYGPDKALDGSNNTFINTARTTNDPWWEVDLGNTYTIDTVKLWMPPGKPQNALNNVYIFVEDGFIPSPTLPRRFTRGTGIKIELPDPPETPITVNFKNAPDSVNKTGRYLRLHKDGSGELIFAQIKVFQSSDPALAKPNDVLRNLAPTVEQGALGDFVRKAGSDTEDFVLAAVKGIDGNTNGNCDADSRSRYRDWQILRCLGKLTVAQIIQRLGIDSPAHMVGYSLVRVGGDGVSLDYPWWEVDLGAERNIGEIKLWRRTDVPADRFLRNAYVFVTDARFNVQSMPDFSDGVRVPLPGNAGAPSFFEERPITVPVNARGRYVRIQRNSLNHELWFSELEVYEQSPAGTDRTRPQPPEISVRPELDRWPNPSFPGTVLAPIVRQFEIRNQSRAQKTLQLATHMYTPQDNKEIFGRTLEQLEVTIVRDGAGEQPWRADLQTQALLTGLTLAPGESAGITLSIIAQRDRDSGNILPYTEKNRLVTSITEPCAPNQRNATPPCVPHILGAHELHFVGE